MACRSRASFSGSRSPRRSRRSRRSSSSESRTWSHPADASLTRPTATLFGLMPSNALLRAALVLTATGIVSASSVRHAIDETGTDVLFAIGYAFYLGLILVATPTRPPRWAPVAGFVLTAVTYVLAIATLQGNVVAIGLYVLAAYLGFLATPSLFRPLTVAAFAFWTPALRFFGPEPLADGFPPILALASVLALFNLVAFLLDRGARDPEERLRRIGLGLLAMATVATVVERHLVVSSRGIAPDDVM